MHICTVISTPCFLAQMNFILLLLSLFYSFLFLFYLFFILIQFVIFISSVMYIFPIYMFVFLSCTFKDLGGHFTAYCTVYDCEWPIKFEFEMFSPSSGEHQSVQLFLPVNATLTFVYINTVSLKASRLNKEWNMKRRDFPSIVKLLNITSKKYVAGLRK